MDEYAIRLVVVVEADTLADAVEEGRQDLAHHAARGTVTVVNTTTGAECEVDKDGTVYPVPLSDTVAKPSPTVEGALLEDIATGTLDAPLPPVRKRFLLDDAEHIIQLCRTAEEAADGESGDEEHDAAVAVVERAEVFARRVTEYLTKEN